MSACLRIQAELFEAVRSRRLAQENNVSDDEDLGLPRSPISNSPTTADDLFTKVSVSYVPSSEESANLVLYAQCLLQY